jgi:aminoglycoside phosphotransferase (APT) family kinase protein
LHTDFNQRNLFVDSGISDLKGIIDWSEAVYGDPIYDFARIRMLIWHFDLGSEVMEKYYKIMQYNKNERFLDSLYFLIRVIEYLAYYSEELNDFNVGRIQLHQRYLREEFIGKDCEIG